MARFISSCHCAFRAWRRPGDDLLQGSSGLLRHRAQAGYSSFCNHTFHLSPDENRMLFNCTGCLTWTASVTCPKKKTQAHFFLSSTFKFPIQNNLGVDNLLLRQWTQMQFYFSFQVKDTSSKVGNHWIFSSRNPLSPADEVSSFHQSVPRIPWHTLAHPHRSGTLLGAWTTFLKDDPI